MFKFYKEHLHPLPSIPSLRHMLMWALQSSLYVMMGGSPCGSGRTAPATWSTPRRGACSMPRDHPTPAPDPPARRQAAEVKMVGYITTAHGTAQRLSETWRHCSCSAPECRAAGGGDGCHVSRPASIWDLSSAGRSQDGWGWLISPRSSLRCLVWRHLPWRPCNFTVWLLHIGDGALALVSSVPASSGVRAVCCVLLFDSRRGRLCRARNCPFSFSCRQAHLLLHCKAPCLYNRDSGMEVPASLAGRRIRPADYLAWRSPV